MTAPPSTTERLAAARPSVGIVHLVTTLEFGGLEKVVFDLVRCRTQETFDARVICLEPPGALAPRFDELAIPVETIGRPADGFARRVVRLARRLRDLKPLVLHTHNPGPHFHGALAAGLGRVPVLVHTKHGRNRVRRRSVRLISRFAAGLSDAIVSVSDETARVSREIERIPASKIRTIRNGIDLEHFAYRGPRDDRSGFRAVTVGRLDPVKDQATLLRALRLAVDQDASISLDIVGDGPLRADLEALRDSLRLERHARFHGFQHDVRPFLAGADVFVLPSLSEGIPITLLEAMATGLPGIATGVGGNAEVIVHGSTGYLVPTGAPAVIAEALLGLRNDPSAVDRLGHAARARAVSEFGLAAMVERYEALYLECLDRRGLGRARRER
jgi:glycosyltransferase involved in cell wall biosynthesis